MPNFFAFQQGTESRTRLAQDSTPLLGRFRAVPGQERRSRSSSNGSAVGLWSSLERHTYGTIFGGSRENWDASSDGDGADAPSALQAWLRRLHDLWIEPQQTAVRNIVDRWYWRWLVLIILPAALTVTWCALPLPQYDFPDTGDAGSPVWSWLRRGGTKTPGHGEAIVQLNFWDFLFIYYGPYNVTALLWVTKVFNIYSLNWWPESLGFVPTFCLILIFSLVVPIPIYCISSTRFLTERNTAWIIWTFITMAMPVLVAATILMRNERHLSLRQSLSETQRIFTSSWWTGESGDTFSRAPDRRRAAIQAEIFEPSDGFNVRTELGPRGSQRILSKRWIPASFLRFIWFCLALLIGLAAYVLGETYAEVYLRTLPHSNIETVFYVYSWVITIHLLDALTGWILGGSDGERVGSYPLGWIFKLYFMLTYQTYVRALYARLRSPSQFIILQILSSTFLICFSPLTMSATFHSFLQLVGINGQSYVEYRKFCGRNVFIRSIAENVSMLAFLGEVVVLHFGSNKNAYPYFAFDTKVSNNSTILQDDPGTSPGFPGMPGVPTYGDDTQYDFNLTFYASMVTWACEIIAGWLTRRILRAIYGFGVTGEGKRDLAQWPELLPTGVIVMVHVLQNMLFGVVRLAFR